MNPILSPLFLVCGREVQQNGAPPRPSESFCFCRAAARQDPECGIFSPVPPDSRGTGASLRQALPLSSRHAALPDEGAGGGSFHRYVPRFLQKKPPSDLSDGGSF